MCGHMCCFEQPGSVARSVAGWLGKEMRRWGKEREFWDTVDTGKSMDGRKKLSAKWLAAVKEETSVERPVVDKAKL